MDGSPLPITVIYDKDGNIKYEAPNGRRIMELTRLQMEALNRGDKDEYLRLLQEQLTLNAKTESEPDECDVIQADCTEWLQSDDSYQYKFDLTFLDPPFNQGKHYQSHDDDMDHDTYWDWMTEICSLVRDHSSAGGSIYFMQREKNCEQVLRCLRQAGWTFQNLITWKKKTSAVPGRHRFGKAYQIIVFATNGRNARTFNRLRINPALPPGYKPRERGIFVTDIWDDIREMTSGYFAGDEPLRNEDGTRLHKQQSPIALLLRIILSSSQPRDLVFDPFAGTATTGIVASQIGRRSILIEKDAQNVCAMRDRLTSNRSSDDVHRFIPDYKHTPELSCLLVD